MFSAANAYRDVLQSAGAFPRDGFDSHIVSHVRKRSGAILNPDSQRTLPPIASGNSSRDMDGEGVAYAGESTKGLEPARTGERLADGATTRTEWRRETRVDMKL